MKNKLIFSLGANTTMNDISILENSLMKRNTSIKSIYVNSNSMLSFDVEFKFNTVFELCSLVSFAVNTFEDSYYKFYKKRMGFYVIGTQGLNTFKNPKNMTKVPWSIARNFKDVKEYTNRLN